MRCWSMRLRCAAEFNWLKVHFRVSWRDFFIRNRMAGMAASHFKLVNVYNFSVRFATRCWIWGFSTRNSLNIERCMLDIGHNQFQRQNGSNSFRAKILAKTFVCFFSFPIRDRGEITRFDMSRWQRWWQFSTGPLPEQCWTFVDKSSKPQTALQPAKHHFNNAI